MAYFCLGRFMRSIKFGHRQGMASNLLKGSPRSLAEQLEWPGSVSYRQNHQKALRKSHVSGCTGQLSCNSDSLHTSITAGSIWTYQDRPTKKYDVRRSIGTETGLQPSDGEYDNQLQQQRARFRYIRSENIRGTRGGSKGALRLIYCRIIIAVEKHGQFSAIEKSIEQSIIPQVYCRKKSIQQALLNPCFSPLLFHFAPLTFTSFPASSVLRSPYYSSQPPPSPHQHQPPRSIESL